MSQPGNRRRRRRNGKNKNEGSSSKDDNSRDELYDDFLLMFGESIDPIEIFNVLKKNDWKPEPSVDDLMAMSVSADAKKPPKKLDTSMFEDDFEYAARASTSQQSAQNLNSHIFSPAKIRQYDGFHDAKVVYKGDNSEEEADADIIIEEEDVSTDHGLRVLQEFTTPFHKNVFMNASAANMPSSFDHVKQKDNQPKTLNRDFERLNIENNSAFQKNSITQMYASGASNLTKAYPPVESATTSIKIIYEGCLEIVDTVDRICSLVLNSIKVIVLLRGCPGSGKSYMAEKIISNVNKIRPEIELQLKNHVFSTDDYFMTPRHGYRFDPKMLPSAHTWNQTRAGKALMQSVNPVIIDNTNTQSWEMAPYVQAGVQYGYVVEILEPETKWKFNEYELFRRNIHGVPRVNIKNMLERYEHGITRNNIFLIFQCKYDPSKQPPQIVPDGEKNSRKIGSKVDTVQSNSDSRPANFPQASNLPNSFPSVPQPASHGQEVDNNNYQPKNNLATQETNFSKLTASCRTFFEKSLLSSATGTDSAKALPTFSNEKSLLSSATGVDNSKSYSVLSNVAKNGEASGAKTANEKLDRNKAPSRNALLSSMMMKDNNMPDVVAKAPSIPQGWLTFSNPVLPKTGSDGDKDVNSVKSNGNLIDFESRELVENLDTSRESGIVTDLYASRRELLSKEATLLSKLKEAISEQAQLKSAFSSVALTCDPSGSTGLKDSQIIDNDNSLPKTFLNVEPLASPKLESVNVNGEVLNAFNNNSCLMDEALPTSSQNLMPCIDLNKPPSNIQHNAELAQVCDIPSSQSKHSTAVAHDSIQKNTEAAQFSDNVSSQTKDSTDVENESELSPREEENIEKMLSIGDEKNHLDSSQSSQDDGSSNKIEGEKENDSNVLKQPCQMTHSTSNEHDHPGSEMNREDSTLKNDKTPNLDNSSGVTEINEASNVGSDLNTENKQSSNPVSKEKVETPLENAFKTFRFETTKVDKNSSSSKKKDLFFSELKDDPVDDFFDDAEISALLQSLVDLDLEFEDVDPANDSDSDEEKPTSNKGNKTVSRTNDSPDKESTVPTTESTNTNKHPTNTLKLTGTSEQAISDSNSTNIPKPTDNSKQLISNNDSTNICQSTDSSEQTNMNSDSTNIVKPTDSSDPSNSKGDSSNISKPIDSSEQQPNLDESLKTCDDSDKCSSISPIAVSPQSKSAAPLSSDESDGLNISTSTRILSDSYYMTVAEDDNISDSVYFDVDSENDKSTNVEPGDSCKRNLDKQRTIEEDEEEKDSSNEPDTSMKIEDEKRRETDSQISFVNDGGSSNKNNDYESFEIIDRKGGEDVVEDASPQSFEAVEENISNNDEKESDLANQISNITLQEEEEEESAKANSSSVEEPAVQKPSNISFDGVKALIKGGVPVKTFDVMSWLKSSLIKESSEEGSGVKNILLEPEEKHSEKNAATNESMMIDESGNVNCKFLEQISKISQEEVDNIATKPAGNVERTVPAVQNCSIIGSNQSNIEGNRRKNKFLNWDSVEDSENSWAEKMKNTLGGSNGIEDDGKVPKPLRENNLLGRLAGLDEKCVNNEQSAAASSKVIEEEEPSSCIEPTDEQANTKTSNESESFSQKLSALVKIFPESQAVFLGEVLRQCQGDVNWAAGILLEGGCERSAKAYCSKDTAAELVEISRKTSDEDQHQASCSKSSLKQKQKKEKKNANNNMCDARLELKKIMEQNFVLSENSYSDHLLKLLKFRRGEIDPEEMMADDQTEAEMDDACDPESTYPDFDPSHPAEQRGATGLPSQPGELDGMDFLNQEPQTAEGIPEDEQMLEFVFNKDVITTLSYNFGSSGFPLDMTGVSCPVKLPMRLARELHSYWMDSVEEFLINENMAMQMMIKEDEELAKRLQQEEASAVNPNLQEVIDYETALMLHEANFKKTREANDSTVAAKLSLSILAEKYPNEKEEFLSQLLSSNNNSLHNTLELLKMTREEQNQSNEQKIADYNKHEFDNCDGSSVFEESETLQSSYERSREEAKMHFLKRNEYFQKAQQEYTSGSKAAASFFSQLANMHMKKMEEANCRSATLLLCTSRSTKNTLDLHFYQVKEAVQVLDLFLDASISRLEESRKPRMKLFIITGRGLHSVNRKSVIRPMVMRRLQQRKIRYQVDDMNPGAIICTLTRCNT